MIDCVSVYFYVDTKEDEAKWKEFLGHYFPNHYAKGILDLDLVSQDGRIGLDKDGFGWLSGMLIKPGNFRYVENFEGFKDTKVYQEIIEQGVILDVGRPKVIPIKLK